MFQQYKSGLTSRLRIWNVYHLINDIEWLVRSSKAIEAKRNDICQKMQGYPGDGNIPNCILWKSLNKETNSSMLKKKL